MFKSHSPNKNKHNIAAYIILLCFAMAFAGLLGGRFLSAGAQPQLSDISSIKDVYDVGDTLIIPDAKITYKGTEYDAVAVTTLPDGTNSVSKNIRLAQTGMYSLYFRTVIDGKEIDIKKEIKVRQKTFSYSGLSYGYYAADTDNALSQINTGKSGQYVRLFRGNKMTYNSVIDLSKLNGGDFISLNVLPELNGGRDMSHLYITLTDVYNKDNYVTIRIYSSLKDSAISEETAHSASWQVRYSYIAASANDSSYVGYETGGNKTHVGNNFGSSALFSFYGYEQNMFFKNSAEEKLPQFLSLSYDQNEKILYQRSSIGKYIITDLDNRDYNPTYVFGGFTTGEVLLSMYVDGLAADSAGILITDIAAQGTENEYLSDDFAPSAFVDTEGYEEFDLPKAVVGVSYPMFEAYGRDAYNGILKASASVFFAYGTSSQYEVNISNNAFIPSVPGMYTVKYTVKNYLGNKTEKLIKVIALKQSDGALQIDDISYNDTYYAGEKVALKIPDIAGGSGKSSLSVDVAFNDRKIDITKNTFVPMSTGTYTVTYTATDYLGQKTEKTADITVTTKSTPVFVDEIILPDYFIAGYSYDLPEIAAYSFINGMNKVPVAIVATGGSLNKVNKTFIPSKDFNSATISYAALGVTIQKTVPIINVKNENSGLVISDFFYKDNLIADASLSEIMFSAENTRKDAGFNFINPLVADGFSFAFRFVSDKTRFSDFLLVLSDKNDRDITLPIMFKKSGTSAIMTVVGNTYTFANAFSSNAVITLQYDKYSGSIILNNNISIRLDNFSGFPSGKVMLSGKINNVYGTAAIAISNISRQKINNAIDDNVRASFAPEDEILLTASINSPILIPVGLSADVLYPNSKCTVSVMLPDGSYAVSEDGIKMSGVSAARSYSVKVSDYGTVRITYYATADEEGLETRPIHYSITVIDEVAPILTLSGKVPSSGKVGKTVKLPSCVAVDNVSSNVTVSILIICPVTSKISYLTESSFVPEYFGDYTVRYIAADEVGNTTILDYAVTVK